MNTKTIKLTAAILILLFAAAASAQTTGFTYQGKLTDTGTPSGDLRF